MVLDKRYPRSGFRSGGTCERTLVPVFRSGGTSERTLVPVFVPGEHPPKSPFWKPPFWVPPNYPVKQGFEANRTRKFMRTFGKIFVTQFLCRTLSGPKKSFPVPPSIIQGYVSLELKAISPYMASRSLTSEGFEQGRRKRVGVEFPSQRARGLQKFDRSLLD